MRNVLFVCAMEKEGKQLAEQMEMKEVSANIFENEDKSKRMLISGIGKQITSIRLTRYLCNFEKPDLIINIGYAGSTDISIGKWVNISRAYNYEWDILRRGKICDVCWRKSEFGNVE